MKKRILFFTFLFISFSFFGQDNLSQNPASLRWSQIKTPHFRLIFPTQISSTVLRSANVLEKVYTPVSKSLGHEPRNISVIFQNQTTESNGFVSLLPRRTEFFTTSPQDYSLLGNNNWLDLLSVHEFRHIVQNDKALVGASKLFYNIFGNNGLAALTSLTVPNWFWEGDAVGIESSLTTSGRGRIPTFDMALRTQLLTKGTYSYSKAVCRSYKDFIPNHYVSGYFMTTYLKNKYGEKAWDNILKNTYEFPFYPFSFSNNIKKTTGLKTEALYRNAFDDISDKWKNQIAEIKETSVKYLKTKNNRYFSNYEFPQILPDGRILALKSGLSDIQQLVILDSLQQEQKVLELGILNESGTLSAVGSKVVWSEFNYDARWGQRDFSVIKMYDFDSKKVKSVTHKSKFTSPSLSPDTKRIVALENSSEGKTSLVILNSENGLEEKRFKNEKNAFYIHPRWSEDSLIYAVKLSDGLKTIVEINSQTGVERELFSPVNENIAYPVRKGDYILFNSGISGIDNIYAVNLKTNQRFQVTNRKFGAFNPSFSNDGKTLYFNDFSIKGHQIVSMPFVPQSFLPFDELLYKPVKYFGEMVLQEAGENLLKDIPTTNFEVKPYRKANIFNVYSWGLVLNSSDANTLNFGVSSKDLLSTTSISGGYTYNANENRGQYYTNISYQGWYPTLNFSYTNGQRQAEFYSDKQSPLDSLLSDRWNQQQIVLGVGLPLNLTRSKFLRSLNVGVNFANTKVSGYDLKVRTPTLRFDGDLNSMIYTLNYVSQLKMATRDIAPRFAQFVNIYYRNLPFESDVNGGIMSCQAGFYFPGMLPHHSLKVQAAFQHQDGFKTITGSPNDNLYLFSSPVFFPRGNTYRAFENLVTASIEYRLPLFEPDFSIGRLLYIKRIKANFFGDFAKGSTFYNWTELKDGKQVMFIRSNIGNYTSLGIDLTAQFHIMRFSQQFEAGFRTIYLPNIGQYLFQPLILNIGF
ncbi:WD40 repeat protein [Arcicella aurantiaca]|uniref:WD40 repeat protein n=1 Tax=Arcicella aurantiaca TaxID=591202 RepID=A0A316DLC5_9BACT|nr:PD40 domain-containing protein [Arcicella aurantiaca]PWK18871.1 WD40 repeat protein [Arcicella aurantiaca]